MAGEEPLREYLLVIQSATRGAALAPSTSSSPSTSSVPALRVQAVEKYYGSRENVTRALDGISLDVARGEFVAVMGPSGSGKTTLLNCISTIDRPSAGHILVDGQDVCDLRRGELARFRRERLGFVFQDANLLDTLTARENIALALTINHVAPREVSARVEAVAARLQISEVLDKMPHEMSGGQRQRVACARAIVCDPALVLADEPTGALDSKASDSLLRLFAEINARGQTIVMVTHSVKAASHAGRVLFLRDGQVYHQLYRGEESQEAQFRRISDTLTVLSQGGETHA